MDIKQIEARIAAIYAVQSDDEEAHIMEDELWEDVLRAIANNEVDSPSTAAYLALTTKNIKFARWCA